MRATSGARGFTLLEVLLAIGILGPRRVRPRSRSSAARCSSPAPRRESPSGRARQGAHGTRRCGRRSSSSGRPTARSATATGGSARSDKERVEDGIPEDDLNNPSELRLAVISVVVEWDESTGVKSYRIGTMRIVPNNG
jgi:prepilin-type N-terminal cleavage/methylation domain-containing protein